MGPGLRKIFFKRQMKVCAMKVVKLPVSLEGAMAVSQQPKPRSINQSSFFAEFAAGGVNYLFPYFDCASRYL
jgi:hypothetical protein